MPLIEETIEALREEATILHGSGCRPDGSDDPACDLCGRARYLDHLADQLDEWLSRHPEHGDIPTTEAPQPEGSEP